MPDLAGLRLVYTRAGLDERDAGDDPLALFERWLTDAIRNRLREPNAMTLATVDAAGAPDARILLLKGFDPAGFVFYTNQESAKGRQLARDPRAALCFHWNELERQVRVQGRVTPLPRAESEAYFASRPRESQLGAWASEQSEPLSGRDHLLARYDELAKRFVDNVPLPDFWGGYRLRPERLEFWQGRVGRLHDRLLYVREGDAWRRSRLYP